MAPDAGPGTMRSRGEVARSTRPSSRKSPGKVQKPSETPEAVEADRAAEPAEAEGRDEARSVPPAVPEPETAAETPAEKGGPDDSDAAAAAPADPPAAAPSETGDAVAEAPAEPVEAGTGEATEAAREPAKEETTTKPVSETVRERVVIQKQGGGFLPLAIGGLAAGFIGYGAAWYQGQNRPAPDTGLADRVGALEGLAGDLEAGLDRLSEGPDLSGIEARIAETAGGLAQVTDRLDAIQAQMTGTVSALSDRIDEFDARVTDLEQRPSDDGTLAEEAIAAYEREVSALRDEMQAQTDRFAAMSADAEAQLQVARDEILAAEAAAEETARAAEARAALGRVQAAVDTGQPFTAALADLRSVSDADIPAVLAAAAEDGIPTTRDLQDSFAATARAALATARDEGLSEDGGGVGGFLRSTFNVRSVAPREGASPDAVLSRIDAAVSDGRITDALAEAETLPEVVRGAMSDWLGAAQSRADAQSALEVLSQAINES